MTAETKSQNVLSYLTVHLFATILSIQGIIWEAEDGGIQLQLATQLLEIV